MGTRVKHGGVAGIDARSKDATSAGCVISMRINLTSDERESEMSIRIRMRTVPWWFSVILVMTGDAGVYNVEERLPSVAR
jgi:hypothetical protein